MSQLFRRGAGFELRPELKSLLSHLLVVTWVSYFCEPHVPHLQSCSRITGLANLWVLEITSVKCLPNT